MFVLNISSRSFWLSTRKIVGHTFRNPVAPKHYSNALKPGIRYYAAASQGKDVKTEDLNSVNGKTEAYREVDDKAFPHFKLQQQIAQGVDFPDPLDLIPKDEPAIGEVTLPHPVWTEEQVGSVRIAHKKPEGFVDWLAYIAVQTMRRAFDLTSGYTFGTLNANNWLRRIIFLETVAGVPGMMGAMVRHLKSLRTMKRDHGWIHTLLEEAENERMHLMVAMHIYNPSRLFRFGAVVTQGIFVNFFFLAYLVSPRFCHRFVGYLEEEAVKTYTKLLNDIQAGKIPEWYDRPAVESAVRYWRLKEGATYYDMFAAIRADEAHHRLVNHTLSSMQAIQHNPFKPGH